MSKKGLLLQFFGNSVSGGGGGALSYEPIHDMPFSGIIFQHKFLNRVLKLIRNSETGYDYLFKNNMLLFSRTIDYCFF